MKKLALLVFTIATLQGCVNYPKLSSNYIPGCEAEDIEVTNNGATGLMSRAWIATCKEKKYLCYSRQRNQYIVDHGCNPIDKDETK